ncbi:threonine dehydratase catabolic, putative [Entamoeba invadens IP1]|uniref:Threonine dehydratase catabolic, putative n=1 Tax=Entamoeba invadens IP1 TaxID=370355 RepID=L7FPX3_ENTIV|nr:threonine dehydratase catabolic, putative [Entamoeba invadens IP1]ELP92245.1 threonine dehydratase catabolic, putative [Entamoeba invadens IP1]|eukprot:XP_004259016.1 threonine dehydratase catabolic, putative [Entamoeba invadens IP1]
MTEEFCIDKVPHEVVGDIPDEECPITIADVYAASRRIQGLAYKTPLEFSNTISKIAGCKTYLKLENLQKTGAFKVRGAINKIATLTPEEKVKGVVAASAGNHAQGVAFASSNFGTKATIVMPEFAPTAKVMATKGYGAEVVLHGKVFDESLAYAKKLCEEEGKVFVHPFDDKYVMAGQGTISLEVLDQLADADVIIGAIGGGGMMGGIGFAAKQLNPNIRVIGVQARSCPSYALTRAVGKMCCLKQGKTMADGIQVKLTGSKTVSVLAKYVDEVVTVDEESIAEAMLVMFERCKIISEGAGATPVAALLSHQIKGLTENTNVVCIVSGGNLDVNVISKVIERGLVKAGRKVNFTLELPDIPGAMKNVISIINKERGTILDILSRRPASGDLHVCICDIEMECYGVEHRDKIFDILKEKGYVFR